MFFLVIVTVGKGRAAGLIGGIRIADNGTTSNKCSVDENDAFLFNGYVEISDIGSTDDTALNCHTNNRDVYIRGDWLAPDGTRVANVPGLYQSVGRRSM